jgi:MFS transporter, Spinster family, sphingosine-1-phosphate transporter
MADAPDGEVSWLPSPSVTESYAIYALVVLFFVNLLNYIDRNILASLLPLIQAEYQVNDKWIGFLGSSFIWVYMVAALPFGYLADRAARNRIVAVGVGVWSAATACSGLVPNFVSLFACRALVGVGEAGYAAASPTMIADYFPPARRNRALSFFFIAIPVGAGLGFVLGGALGEAFGWRRAFLFAAAPGLVFTVVMLLLREPARGVHDVSKDLAKLRLREAVRRVLRIRSYVWVIIGQTLLTFSLGGVAVWLPTYFVRAHGMTLAQAGTFCGGALVIGSLAGTVFGGMLADYWGRYSRNALLHTMSSGLAIAAIILPAFLFVENRSLLFVLLLVINFFLFWHTGPVNTLISNVSPPNVRAMAISVQILLIHILGDAFSPGLMGVASDALQARGASEADALRWVLLTMLPIPVFFAAVLSQIATLWAPADMAKVIGAHALDRDAAVAEFS